ncbi:mediator complex subunit MED6 KNAG_0B04710 [Huiozyma naganishii CBS 8797]|uniref:Mediator of RNA polymerase II transcription subunit 6 n=1 Tax=Huiozyma naganishii (strain ATCC MYA-139 / BCRC 22969 / CBS 8797 / KCTC 17520 / NBRC 10181 / NCYC 3082 / Yp74L-3) TaxID=1071383 RepID=J7S500_HUIN7|nr:hypothetical protein KNAG_0B04710 [Kazachstania naganishii CBS 8797]CCK68906.1 hypothetical protein KNAG_0B04710 [Kazachstania naganishii CBS 8797]
MDIPLDELQWKSPEWIQAFGLRTDNVLDYFSESPFFDKTSNNHVIKMQRQFSQLPVDGMPQPQGPGGTAPDGSKSATLGDSQEFSHLDPLRREVLGKYPLYMTMERELCKLRGVEYVLACVREPDFWVVKKQRRLSPRRTEPMQDYYIIGANVYQSPSMFKILQNRMMSASYHLSNTLNDLQKLVHFQPSQGVQFKTQSTATDGAVQGATQGAATTTPMPGTAPNTALGPLSAVPTTAAGSAQTAGNTSPYENGTRELISKEMMDKLMATSIRSQPECIQ